MNSQLFVIAVAILGSILCFSEALPPTLTKKEKSAVKTLREAVKNKLTLAYMKSDAYLLKWVKEKNFDQNDAKIALENALEWRRENKIDNLPFEDFPDAEDYPLSFTEDKEGRSVVLITYLEWDVRKIAVEGKVKDLGRRMDYWEEKAAQMSFNATGDPTSMVVVDINGYSLRKHACAGCIPFYLNWTRNHELYYPYNLYKIYGINAPRIFNSVVELVRPLMTPATSEAFRIFGTDKAEWSAKVLETIDPSKLPPRFGGTRQE